MKDETGSVAIIEFIRLKLKIYSFFGRHNSEHKKAKMSEKKCCYDNKL